MADKVTMKIPRELYEKLREMIEGTGFSSVTGIHERRETKRGSS